MASVRSSFRRRARAIVRIVKRYGEMDRKLYLRGDGLDRHAAGGDFEKKSRERDCASEISFGGYNDGVSGWKWEMSAQKQLWYSGNGPACQAWRRARRLVKVLYPVPTARSSLGDYAPFVGYCAIDETRAAAAKLEGKRVL